MNKLFFKKYVLTAISLLFSIVAVVYLIGQAKEKQNIKSHASAGDAQILFIPESLSLTSQEKTIPLWIKTNDIELAFIHLEILFDNNLIELTKDPVLVSNLFNRVVKISSLSEANSTGRIIVVAGLDPKNKLDAPKNMLQLLSLSLRSKGLSKTSLSNMDLSKADSQIVSINSEEFSIISNPLLITVNPDINAQLVLNNLKPLNPQRLKSKFTVDVAISSKYNDLYNVLAKIKYDTTKLKLIKIEPVKNSVFRNYPIKSIDSKTGVATISASVDARAHRSGSGSIGFINFARLTFSPLTVVNSTEIKFEDSQVNIKSNTNNPQLINILDSTKSQSITVVSR